MINWTCILVISILETKGDKYFKCDHDKIGQLSGKGSWQNRKFRGGVLVFPENKIQSTLV